VQFHRDKQSSLAMSVFLMVKVSSTVFPFIHSVDLKRFKNYSLKISMSTIMSSTNSSFIYSFLIYVPFILFSCLNATA
jgi:hypothetical protein